MTDIFQYLRKYFGFNSFRPGQEDIIHSILNGNDTMAVMPTGGGKSICYQIPALIFDGTSIVISPLISLMKDQVDALVKRGIPAAFINSSMSVKESRKVLEEAQDGVYKMLYIAPERLQTKKFAEILKNIDIAFIAVDEAHCISEWGHDFRPAYLRIPDALEKNRSYPIAAFTATATPEVQDDIAKSLQLKDTKKFIKGFDRPNLSYVTKTTEDKLEEIVQILRSTPKGTNIIYAGSRKRVEEFSTNLTEYGIKAEMYHAGLPDDHRKEVQNNFAAGKSRVIVATNAFGMGIDKEDVRNVIHVDLTGTIEAYYQEAGRAGRDGKPAKCILLYHPGDRTLQEFFIDVSYPAISQVKRVYDALYKKAGIGEGGYTKEPLNVNSALIAAHLSMTQKTVSASMRFLRNHNIISSSKYYSKATIQFHSNKEILVQYFNSLPEWLQDPTEAIFRSCDTSENSREQGIDPLEIAQKQGVDANLILKAINKLSFEGHISYNPKADKTGIYLLRKRIPFEDLPIDFEAHERHRHFAFEKLDIVQEYAETDDCKRNFILEYFSDDSYEGVCGRCSSCLTSDTVKRLQNEKREMVTSKIINALDEINSKFGKTIFRQFLKGKETQKIQKFELQNLDTFGCLSDFTDKEVKEYLDYSISNKYITVSPDKFPTLSITEKGMNFVGKKFEEQVGKIVSEHNFSDELFKRLKNLRDSLKNGSKSTSDKIISNEMLMKLASDSPKNILELKKLKGYDIDFVRNYGSSFVKEINNYYSDEPQETPDNELTDKTKRIVVLYQKGLSIENIEERMKLTKEEIYNNLKIALENDIDVDISNLINIGKYNEILDLVEDWPDVSASQAREELGTDIDYPLLKVALAKARNELEYNE